MQWYHEAFVGFTGNAFALSVVAPIEILKAQSQVSGSEDFRGLAKNIYTKNGVRGFYKGLSSALLTQPVFWTMYFPFYNYLKSKNYNRYLSSYMAGAAGIIASNPLWVMRTRFQTELLRNESYTYPRLIKDMMRRDGPRSFYRGTGVTLVKNSQIVIQFPLYEELKLMYERSSKPFGNEGPLIHSMCGATAKVVSSTITFPMDVIRTNLRLEPPSTSWNQMLKKILQRPGGYKNLCRGLSLYLCSAAPTFAITMTVYEIFKKKIQERD